VSGEICQRCKTPIGPREIPEFPGRTNRRLVRTCQCEWDQLLIETFQLWKEAGGAIVTNEVDPIIAEQLHREKVERLLEDIATASLEMLKHMQVGRS